MALTIEQINELKELFDNSKRPLIIFDDDPDGLSSFLMVYRYVGEGRGVPDKGNLVMDERFAEKVNSFSPDLVVILDKPVVSQSFIDAITAPVVWVDHHPPLERKGVKYFNPLLNDPSDRSPTSYWIYQVVKRDLWIAMVGIIGDWFVPEKELWDELRSSYPDLLPEEIILPERAHHDTVVGKLIRIFFFNLKGKVSDVIKSMKVLTRINDPYEILDQTSPPGRFLYKRYERMNNKYQIILESIKINPDDRLAVVKYQVGEISFTAILSNELIYRHPDKVLIVAWDYEDEFKCSLRSTDIALPPLIKKALNGLRGGGGGHEHAVGMHIHVDDFDEFVSRFRKLVEKKK